jgi:hypothetical protein
VFPVRYELNSYILFRRNSVLKGLMKRKYETRELVALCTYVSYVSLYFICFGVPHWIVEATKSDPGSKE